LSKGDRVDLSDEDHDCNNEEEAWRVSEGTRKQNEAKKYEQKW